MYIPPICYGIVLMWALEVKNLKHSQPHPVHAERVNIIARPVRETATASTNLETFIPPTERQNFNF